MTKSYWFKELKKYKNQVKRLKESIKTKELIIKDIQEKLKEYE